MEDGASPDAVTTLNVVAVAERLGLPKGRVRKLIADGELRGEVVSGAYKVSVTAVEEFERRRAAAAAADTPANDPVLDATVSLLTKADGLPMLLSIEATAEFLDLPVKAVRKAVRDGQIPSVAVGARRYVPRPQLVAWIAGAA